jgi:hypothetical protein
MNVDSEANQMISGIIERLEQVPNLYLEKNFVERLKAIDVLEFHLLDEDDTRLTEADQVRLRQLKYKLDAANEALFARLLACIHANDHDTVRLFFQQAEQQMSSQTNDETDYDELDMLVNGLLDVDLIPEESLERDADMMFYQPTQVRIVLKLIDLLDMNTDDVFYDLGSGLGHVPILITLLTGIKTKGVERDDAYIRYSEARLKKLKLSHVEFIHADVRDVDYSDGTIFYLYTPFRGALLEQVMRSIEAQSKQRSIRVCAYGPVTLAVSQLKWLQPIYQAGKKETHLGIFKSL